MARYEHYGCARSKWILAHFVRQVLPDTGAQAERRGQPRRGEEARDPVRAHRKVTCRRQGRDGALSDDHVQTRGRVRTFASRPLPGRGVSGYVERAETVADGSDRMNFFGCFGNGEADALALLMPVVDRALEAHRVGDYPAYRSLITDELAAAVSEAGFMRAHREVAPALGALRSKVLLASLRRGSDPMLVFAARYAATADDVLITVTFRDGTAPPLIAGLWIE